MKYWGKANKEAWESFEKPTYTKLLGVYSQGKWGRLKFSITVPSFVVHRCYSLLYNNMRSARRKYGKDSLITASILGRLTPFTTITLEGNKEAVKWAGGLIEGNIQKPLYWKYSGGRDEDNTRI